MSCNTCTRCAGIMRTLYCPNRTCPEFAVIDQELSMKSSLRLVCIAVSVLCTMFGHSHVAGQSIGDGYFANTAPVQGMADINIAWPGRVWVQANLADQGLGYRGTYFTVGSKQHLFQDNLDGRWLLEARGHLGTEADNGGWFANIGLERVFSIQAANAEITTGIWFDWDEDLQGDFAHTMQALSANLSVETDSWMAYGNGYFPIGETDYQLAEDCFLNNLLVTQPGIDSALQGFDAMLLAKPYGLRQVNGTIGIGGYSYSSSLVDSFAGIRGRFGMQLNGGMIVQGELNHDDRFDITGVLQLGWMFGAGAKGTEYGLLGNDLEPTLRNDHVVRFQQDLQLAIDPDTGRAYNVYHVDNLAAPGGDGSFERPFDNLAAAETASIADDIIFVNEGGGSTRNMDQGITLKEGQLLLGDGVAHLIPLADGTNFVLCNDVDGLLPSITNSFGAAVDLAGRNTVAGFNIDGDAGNIINGIRGDTGSALIDGIIENNNIFGTILDGVFLNNVGGDWTFTSNTIRGNLPADVPGGFNGININSSVDTFGTFQFVDNDVSWWNRDGIRINNFDAFAVTFTDNATSNNGGHGISLTNHNNTAGTGVLVNFLDTEIANLDPALSTSTPTAFRNTLAGINLESVSGDIRFLNMEMRENQQSGIQLTDVTTPLLGQGVFIGTEGAGLSIFDSNAVGTEFAQIYSDLGVPTPNGIQNLTITDSSIVNGGNGISAQASNVGASLNTAIVDNLTISGNAADGIKLTAFDGGTHRALVENTGTALEIDANNGNGININSFGTSSLSLVEATIHNVNVTDSGFNGINADIVENGQAIVSASASNIVGASDGIGINVENSASTAVSVFNLDDLSISGIADDGIGVNVGANSFVDLTVQNSIISNALLGAPAGNHGIEITAVGSTATAAVDTRVRLDITGNTIESFLSGDGIGILAGGDAHVLAQIEANSITDNGFNNDVLPFGDGINITAVDESQIFTRIVNNLVTRNAEQGLRFDTFDEGSITAVVVGNNMAGNDLGEDAGNDPTIDNNIADMAAVNAVSGNICLAMTNNFFTLDVVLNNLSGPGNFLFERNGLTVSEPQLIFLPSIASFSIGTFSLVCEPAIEAEEAIFDSLFP